MDTTPTNDYKFNPEDPWYICNHDKPEQYRNTDKENPTSCSSDNINRYTDIES